MSEVTKELTIENMSSPWGWVRVWTIRTAGKVTPVQVLFWNDEYQLARLRPEAKQIVAITTFHVEGAEEA